MSVNEIDWSSLKKSADDATKPAPDGDWDVEFTKAEATHASTTGNPMIKAQAKIIAGAAQGKTVFHNFNITPDSAFAMSIFFRYMDALGIDPITGSLSVEQIASMLVGRRVRVTLSTRVWQNTARNNIDNMMPIPGAPNSGGPAGPAVPSPSATPAATPGVPSTPSSVPSTPSQTPAGPSSSGSAPPIPAF